LSAGAVSSEGGAKKKRRPPRSREFLEPLRSRVKERPFCVIDVESKDGDSQAPGFTRPFLVGLYDPLAKKGKPAYLEFRNEPHLAERDWRHRHVAPGGCVDKLMTTILTDEYAGRIFYAHNGGNFDFLFLPAWLVQHQDEYAFEVVPIQTTIQVIRVWERGDDPEKPKRRWEFLDSMRLLAPGMSLAKACDTFKVPGKAEHDLALHEDDPSWSVYLKQDCVALSEVMKRLYALVARLQQLDVPDMGITAPATAMKLFLRRFLGKGDVPEKIARHRHWPDCQSRVTCKGCFHEWMRTGYCGGRTEPHVMKSFEGSIFTAPDGTLTFSDDYRSHGGVHYFDVNSSYVASMREDMPIGDLVVEEGRIDWRRHPSRGGRYSGFAEVTVEIPVDCPIPPLPKVHPDTNKLVFPVGRFNGVWSMEELLLLEDPIVGGRIVDVRRVAWMRLHPMFRDMVDELWALRAPQCPQCVEEMRAKGSREPCPHFDEGLSALAKLMGNSTYGKFAMKHERTSIVFAREHEDGHCDLCGVETNGPPLCREHEGSKPASADPDDCLWYQTHYADAPYIIPHVAAFITSHARVRLWKVMREVVTRRGPRRTAARDLVVGDVAFLDPWRTQPFVVSAVEPGLRRGELQIIGRTWDVDGSIVRARMTLDELQEVGRSGIIYYLDTDSCLTDVVIASGTRLGEMKDEYPGELLEFECLQPKLYVVFRTSLQDALQPRRAILLAAWRGEDVDASTLDRALESCPGIKGAALGFKLRQPKCTMKGFDPVLRTVDTFERLRRGEVVDSVPLRGGGSRPWKRLEKVRTLARGGFKDPPAMREVEKSRRSAYDKRELLADGVRTRAIALNEPVGGFSLDEAAE
jgi:hypothetical protein